MKSNRPGLRNRGGERQNNGSNPASYIRFAVPSKDAAAWDSLTAQLVMARARAGTLDPGTVAALLLAAGLEPES